jgi:hypothetical protein
MRPENFVFSEALLEGILHLLIALLISLRTKNPFRVIDLPLKVGRLYSVRFSVMLPFLLSRVKLGIVLRMPLSLVLLG